MTPLSHPVTSAPMRTASSPSLILASASPRRRKLLLAAGVPFEVIPADIPEQQKGDESPIDFVRRLAADKAFAVCSRIAGGPARLVLGADTIVVVDDCVLGKPDDLEHASQLLARLLGRSHRVITGVAVVDSARRAIWEVQVTSEVCMRAASKEEREAYVATGEGLDKAGAYALQGEGRRFVEHVVGSETNVIGLPIEETLELLRVAEGDAR